MIVVVLGASGGVGRHVVTQALDAGHRLRLVLRDPSRSPVAAGNDVGIVRLDLAADVEAAPAELTSVLDGADVVLSALGSRSVTDHGILTRAATTVADAMQTSGVRRYVGVSAAPIATVASPRRPHPPRHDPGDDLLTRTVLMPLVKRVFRAVYADTAGMEDVIRGSGLDWTLVRPPRLTDTPPTGRYRVAVDRNVHGGRHVSRGDVAALMLASVDDRSTVGHSLGVAD